MEVSHLATKTVHPIFQTLTTAEVTEASTESFTFVYASFYSALPFLQTGILKVCNDTSTLSKISATVDMFCPRKNSCFNNEHKKLKCAPTPTKSPRLTFSGTKVAKFASASPADYELTLLTVWNLPRMWHWLALLSPRHVSSPQRGHLRSQCSSHNSAWPLTLPSPPVTPQSVCTPMNSLSTTWDSGKSPILKTNLSAPHRDTWWTKKPAMP